MVKTGFILAAQLLTWPLVAPLWTWGAIVASLVALLVGFAFACTLAGRVAAAADPPAVRDLGGPGLMLSAALTKEASTAGFVNTWS